MRGFLKTLLYKNIVILQIFLSVLVFLVAMEALHLVFIKQTIPTYSTDGLANPFLPKGQQDNWLSGERLQKKKLILMVVDALGFYLAEPNLKSLSKLSREQPDKAILLKSVTDSLTVTGPRLLSMMTGTNPSVIDLIQNVEHSSEVKIDNILGKLEKKKQHIYFTGDNTWLKLFPNAFESSNDKESYNVFAKDEQDSSNKNFLLSTLRNKQQSQDADLIISHFLGIDHVFHKDGVESVEAPGLFKDYDKFINELIEAMSIDHVLVVCSDHGATPKGTHGGDSKEERETFFFMYSKEGIANNQSIVQQIMQDIPNFAVASQYKFADDQNKNSTNSSFQNLQEKTSDKNETLAKEESNKYQYQSIMQLDTSVNLSNILGLTLPYSSLGMVWPFFYQRYVEGDEQSEKNFKDNIANDCFTIAMQQSRLVKEHKVYTNLVGEDLINQFQKDAYNLKVIYKNYQKSNGDINKLRELFNASFSLNIDIKNSLWEKSQSQDTKSKLISMCFFISQIIILACLLVARKLSFESEDKIVEQKNIDSSSSLSSSTNNKEEYKRYQVIQNEEVITIIQTQKEEKVAIQNEKVTVEEESSLNFAQKKGIIIVISTCIILCLFQEYVICSFIFAAANLLVLFSFYPLSLKAIALSLLSLELIVVGEFIVNSYIITLQTEFFLSQDADFFKMLVTALALLLILKKFHSLLKMIPLIFLVFAAQYFSSNPSPYPAPCLSDFVDIYVYKQATSILLHPIIRIYLPAIILFYLIISKIPNQQLKVYKGLLLTQMTLSVFFIAFNDSFPDDASNDIIMVYLPRLQILLFAYQTYHLIKLNSNKNKQQSIKLTAILLLFTLNLASILMIFLEQKSILATLIFFSIMIFFRLYLNSTNSPPSSISYVLITFAISFVFFYSTEHRYGFGNLQIKAGYIGMGSYLEVYAVPLIMLNTFAWHLYSLLLYPAFISAHQCKSIQDFIFEENQDLYNKKEQTGFKSEIQITLFQFFIVFLLKYFVIFVTFSRCLGNDQNHKLLPFLVGDTMISGLAIFTISMLLVWSNNLEELKKTFSSEKEF